MLNERAFRLFYVIRSLHGKDSSPVRQAIYKRLVESSLLHQTALLTYRKSSAELRFLFVFAYSFLVLGKIPRKADLARSRLAVWVNPSEKKAIDEMFLDKPESYLRINFSIASFITNLCSLRPKAFLRLSGFFFRLARRYDFLYSLRIAELVLFYSFTKSRTASIKKYFVSSDAAPETLGIFLSLWDSAETFYTPHGIVPAIEARLFYKFGYYSNRYDYHNFAKRSYGQSVLVDKKKWPNFTKKLDEVTAIGVVGPVAPNPSVIKETIDQLRNQFPKAKIRIKLHPNQVGPQMRFDKNVECSVNVPLDQSDFAICSNTGHIIKMLQESIPVLYVGEMDVMPHDTYGLKSNGVVYSPESIDNIKVSEMLRFYNSSSWAKSWEII